MYLVHKLNDLIEARIVRRINRFIVEVKINDEIALAHNTNTGRLKDFIVENRKALLLRRSSENTKTRYRLVGVEDIVAGDFAVIDTIAQNMVFEKIVDQGLLNWLNNCRVVSRNPVYKDVRFDYKIVCSDKIYLVETKSAVLRGENNEAMYPDCPTERGRRHIERLIRLSETREYEPMLIFIAAMKNPSCFKPYRQGDPLIEKLVIEAIRRNIPVKALSIYMNKSGEIFLDNPDLLICSDFLSEANLLEKRNINSYE